MTRFWPPINKRLFGFGACWLLMMGFELPLGAQSPSHAANYSQWPNGPPNDPSFFPIAVWLQSPANAARYRSAGFNTYVGLWHGPTATQLAELKRAGMKLICEQNPVARNHLSDATIIG